MTDGKNTLNLWASEAPSYIKYSSLGIDEEYFISITDNSYGALYF